MFKRGTVTLIAASFILPASAQTVPMPTQNHSQMALKEPETPDSAGSINGQTGRSMIVNDNGSLRLSKIVGSPVYNDHDDKIGSIDDLVIGNDHAMNVVLSVGGFLGIGSKMVAVPFEKLAFANIKGSSDRRVVLPGLTKQKLSSMPDFHYNDRG